MMNGNQTDRLIIRKAELEVTQIVQALEEDERDEDEQDEDGDEE